MADCVNWRNWDRKTFADARDADLPVLLVLESSWSGLSRLMHNTAWNNQEVASAVHEAFVPIRVDADCRPDVDRRYRMGELPTVAFITPDAKPITAANYLSNEALLNALRSVSGLYRMSGDEVNRRVSEMDDAVALLRARRADPTRLPSPWMTTKIIEVLRTAADQDFGGFGGLPKYPQFDSIEFLLDVYARTQEQDLLELATAALSGMIQGGLYDWESGGFFRVSDDADWSTAQCEKLLVDQARHLELLARAYAITGDEDYADAARGTLEWVHSVLYRPAEGCFAASQAGDMEVFGPGPQGRISVKSADVDERLYLDCNLRMARALLNVAGTLGDPNLNTQAVRCLQTVRERLCPEEGFVYHYWGDGAPELRGLLPDQVEYGLALLAANQAQPDDALVARALSLAHLIHERLFDPRQPGYFDAEDPMGLGMLWERDKAYEDNMALAVFFARLARVTGDEEWNVRARGALAGFTGVWEKLGVPAAAFGLGLVEVFAEHE